MLIAHGPIAFVSNFLILKKKVQKQSKTQKLLFLFWSFFCGILPDFGIFYLAAKGLSSSSNRDLITHTPFLWISIYLILLLLIYLFKWKETKIYADIFIISTLSHLLFDLIPGSIMLLYPFSQHSFTLLANIIPVNIFAGYILNPAFGLELVLIAISLLSILKFFKIDLGKWKYIPLILTSIYLLFNIFIYTQTYQTKPIRDNLGKLVLDIDGDRLPNQYDFDVDNNGKNNFKQADKTQLAIEVEKILSSNKKIVSSKSRRLADIVYVFYGGLTVREVIIQAYSNIGQPLQPIIYDFMQRQNISDFNEAFEDFVSQNGKNISKTNAVPGDIVSDENIGIVRLDGTLLKESN